MIGLDQSGVLDGGQPHAPSRATVKYSRLHQNWRAFFVLLTIVADSAAIMVAGATSYLIRESLNIAPAMQPDTAIVIVLLSCGIIILIALVTGRYRLAYRVPLADQYRDTARSYVYSACTIVFALSLILGRDLPPRFTGGFLTLAPLFLLIDRWGLSVVNRYFQNRGYGRYNAMIVKWNDIAANFPERFTMFPELGYAVRAFACNNATGSKCRPGECALQSHFAHMPHTYLDSGASTLPCYSLDELPHAVEAENIERMFVPLVQPVVDGFSEIVRSCMQARVKLKVFSRESEELLRFSRVKDVAGISLYSPPKRRTARVKRLFKRAFDVGGGLILVLIFLPVLVLVPIAILLEDGRPVFFRQRRASMKGGKSFDVFKFRSMTKGAEVQQRTMNKRNETEGGLFLLKSDPRVTCVGHWIRKFSMDELPQLFNVLKGEMSLVGPRPLMLSDLDNISTDNDYAGYYYLRDKTRPGITGLWQICGRRNVPFREMVLLDLYYIENQSIMFDLEILFATIPVVLFGRGAY